MDIDDALFKVCETENKGNIYSPEHMRHACEVVLNDWNDELESFIEKRQVVELKQMNEKFCGNGRKVKSISMACYNITNTDFGNWGPRDLKEHGYFIFDPRSEMQDKIDEGASEEEMQRIVEEMQRNFDL